MKTSEAEMNLRDFISAAIPSDRAGFPGIEEVFWISPALAGESDEDVQAKLHDRTRREFKVICIFSKTISFDGSPGGVQADDQGTSNISLPRENSGVSTPRLGRIYFAKNKEGLMSAAYARFEADSLDQAHSLFIEHLTPLIDWLSFAASIPFHIDKVHCFDLKSNAQKITATPSYPTVVFPDVNLGIAPELVALYSLYREAKSTLNPFYQCICFYKILEGVFDKIRPDLYKRAAARGISVPRFKGQELVPLNDEMPELVGKSIQEIKQTTFNKEYRNAMSHFTLDSTSELNLSRSETKQKFCSAVVVLDLCVRAVIPNLEKQLAAYHQAGGI